jgi:hypothetical protein
MQGRVSVAEPAATTLYHRPINSDHDCLQPRQPAPARGRVAILLGLRLRLGVVPAGAYAAIIAIAMVWRSSLRYG